MQGERQAEENEVGEFYGQGEGQAGENGVRKFYGWGKADSPWI